MADRQPQVGDRIWRRGSEGGSSSVVVAMFEDRGQTWIVFPGWSTHVYVVAPRDEYVRAD